jgi:hypothetical protein
VYAVGDGGIGQHYDGTAWTMVNMGTTNNLSGISGSSAQDIWAVGASGTILRNQGSGWSSVTSPTTNPLYTVVALSTSLAFAGGQGVILKWDGVSWSIALNMANSSYVSGSWAAAIDNAYLVGGYSGGGQIYHWNGTTLTNTANPPVTLSAVGGSDANNIWTVGNSGSIYRWNGTTWNSVISPNGLLTFTGIYATGANQAWVVGNGNVGSGIGEMYTWDGASWNPTSVSNIPLTAITGVASGAAWTVGVGGAILHYVK